MPPAKGRLAGLLLLAAVLSPAAGDTGAMTQRAALGRMLFAEPRLSAGGGLSCASCHRPEKAFSDGLARAVGEAGRTGPRNTPTLAGVAGRAALFWDGAETDLDKAAVRPLFDPAEMANASGEDISRRLRGDARYGPLFERAFGSREISVARMGSALAAFLATVSSASRYDAYRAGDLSALDAQQLRGLAIFQGKAGCSACHTGRDLTDDGFHNTGTSMPGEAGADTGRYGVTGDPGDAGRFRTPTLRAVSATAPYMHNGAFPDLDAVIRFYERGGGTPWLRDEREASDPVLRGMASVSPRLRPFVLTPEERRALAAFLGAL